MNSKEIDKSMTDKEKADCMIELHKSQLDHFMQTREIEFKVNLSLWTLIILAGYFLYGKIHLNCLLSISIYSVLALLLYFMHIFLWMMPIQKSEDTDDHYIREYRNKVQELIKVTLAEPEPKKHLVFLWNWHYKWRTDGWSWIFAETGITFILLVLLGLALYLG